MAAIPFAIRYTTTKTVATLAVYSLSNAAVSVSVNGRTFAPSMGGVGTDGNTVSNGDSSSTYPTCMYVGTVTIDGLLPNKRYAGTVTQSGVTENITVVTAPENKDFEFFVVSCDKGHGNADSKGVWGELRDRANGSNVVAIMHVDDHGYTDTWTIANSSGNERWNGTHPTNATAKTTYGYVVGYAAFLGLLSGEEIMHDEDRIWCHHNLPTFVWPGDHEYVNDAENNVAGTDVWRNKARDAFKQTIGAVMPEMHVSHCASVTYLGPCEIIGIDRAFQVLAGGAIFNDGTQVNAGGILAGYRWIGTQQIADITGAIDSESPFKVIMMPMQPYFISTAAERVAENSRLGLSGTAPTGSQQPLHGYTVDSNGDSEWNELVRDSGGIADVANAYGGAIVSFHGDTHYPSERHIYKPLESGRAMLSMRLFSTGSANAWHQHALSSRFKAPHSFEGITFNWSPSWTEESQLNPGTHCTCLHVTMHELDDGNWEMCVKTIVRRRSDGKVWEERERKVKSGSILPGPDGYRNGYI